jgi:sugar phosphate isomerase/epimerase
LNILTMQGTRRSFLGAIAGFSCTNRLSRAAPLELAPGVQLWSVREQLKQDFTGTLRRLHSIGYREVELFELPPSPREFRKQVADAGLACISGHFELMNLRSAAIIAAAQELGLKYMILVFPELRAWKGQSIDEKFRQFVPRYEHISLADYQWNADQLNHCGATLNHHGIKAGFHNHAIDLKDLGNGQHGLDYLIQHTDPDLVCFEMDCGHVVHAGHDPVAYLNRYPKRIELLHLKDLAPGYHVSTTLDTEEKDRNSEIGAGVIDWKKLFQAASHAGNVKHCFVEHEGKMDHPPLEALQNSYNYLQTLKI